MKNYRKYLVPFILIILIAVGISKLNIESVSRNENVNKVEMKGAEATAGESEKVKLLEGAWIGLVDLYSSRGARDDVIAELYTCMGNYDHTEGMERLTNKFIENDDLTASILGIYGYRKENPEDFLEESP